MQKGSSPLLPLDGRGSIVTLGSFDGVHRGHQQILLEIAGRARRTGRRSVLVTFHPHPLRIVRPAAAPKLLTTPAEKKACLAAFGLDYVLFLRFTPELQQYSARRFVEEILLGRLGMKELVIGHDHAFGKGREGTADFMRSLGEELGFAVDVISGVRQGDALVSSSVVRRHLGEGDVVAAANALGRPYSLEGLVVEGMKKGRELGFPTANIRIDEPEKLLPRPGVYAVRGIVDGESLPGLLHLGPRPTFSDFPPSVELHLLDWSGDLYGKWVRVELCSYLREVERFDSVDDLVAQMHVDAARGREILADTAVPLVRSDLRG